MISYFLGVRFSRGTIDRKRVIKIILSLSIFPLSLLTLGFILFRSRGDTLGQPYLIHNTNVLIVIAFIDIVACIALLIINALFSFVGNFVGQLTKPQS